MTYTTLKDSKQKNIYISEHIVNDELKGYYISRNKAYLKRLYYEINDDCLQVPDEKGCSHLQVIQHILYENDDLLVWCFENSDDFRDEDHDSVFKSDITGDYHLLSEKIESYCDKVATEEEFSDDDYYFCDDIDKWVHADDVQCCEISGQNFSPDADFVTTHCGANGEIGQLRESNDYVYSGVQETWYYIENTSWCTDIDDYVHEDNATWCERTEEYYYDDSNMPSNNDNEHICSYHDSPDAENLNTGEYKSNFSVGFEIEKTDFDGYEDEGDYIGQKDVFKGYELDSSCGVEAITNILPLSTNENIQKYVFDMMDDASTIINSNYSSDCGGHITISVNGHTPDETYEKIRPSIALYYALYRYRLNNTYCNGNKKAKKDKNKVKYTPFTVKPYGVEIRLPNAVKNVEQLKKRYKIVAIMVTHVFNTNDTFTQLLEKVKPVLSEMYNTKEKLDHILAIAVDFHNFLVDDTVTDLIKPFVSE